MEGDNSLGPADDWAMDDYDTMADADRVAAQLLAGVLRTASADNTMADSSTGNAGGVGSGGAGGAGGSNVATTTGPATTTAGPTTGLASGAASRNVSTVPSIFAMAAPPAPKAEAATARAKEREELNTGVLMFRNPLPIATVVVRGCEFPVHADLLCKHSDYFRGCLRGPFAEAQTQRVELDDDEVSVEDFGLWVDLLYRAHFHEPHTFLLRKEETGGTLSTKQILVLWRLSDRFLHHPLARLAEESLEHRLSLYSPDQWRKLYRTRPATDLRARVGRLQDAYRQCIDQGIPFADRVVEACANCPPQVYAACVDLLDADFMAPVSRRIILAQADPALLSKDQRMTGSSTSLGLVREALAEERALYRDHQRRRGGAGLD